MHTRHTLLHTAFVNGLLLLGLASAAHATSPLDVASQRYGVFAEPLLTSNTPSPAEKNALMKAINAYRQTGDAGNTVALERYIAAHPKSPWRASLWLDIGLAKRDAGRFSAAIRAFDQARDTAQATRDPALRKVAIRAMSEQLLLETRLGHQQAVIALIKEAQQMGMSVQDTMAMSLAEDGLWDMQHHPERAFQCGWIALQSLWRLNGIEVHSAPPEAMSAGQNGYNLAQLVAMSTDVHHPVTAVRIDNRSEIPVPSIAHWKTGHFATILSEQNGRYRVADPTVTGGSLWMSADAVHSESSGYFLVPTHANTLASNEHLVSPIEAATIRGAGYTTLNDPHGFCGCNQQVTGSNGSSGGVNGAGGNTGGATAGAVSAPAPSPSNGMPSYSISPMLVSLTLTDTPLSYAPPKGMPIDITFNYNQLDIDQPTTFTFGNVGPLWTHNWLSYVQDDPNSAGNNVLVYMPGGPGRLYAGFNSSNGTFTPEAETGAQLVETSSSPVTYQRRYRDGSVDIYSQSDNSTSYPRHIFLTQRIDAQGNAVQLAYDSQNRLTTLTDALGQAVTFHYANTSFPLQVTSVSDAFGRSTTLAYTTTGQLSSITDAIGMTSSFTYASGTSSITASTTPYGTTQFSTGQSGIQRWINVTDPNGNVSRMEFNEGVSGVPFSEGVVPSGMTTFNEYINDRNTFYWDAQAYKLDAGNYADAVIYHWDHVAVDGQLKSDPYTTADSLESIKYPLENRIWYNHPNDVAGGNGSLNTPTNIGRVLSNGTTQLTQNTYDAYGHLLTHTDPSGLTTTYTYASNGIDVLSIQRTGTGYSATESFTYNGQHNVLSHADETGATTSYTYNAAGQPLTVTDALGHTTSYAYNAQGYKSSMTDANGHVTSYTYDAVGRLASVRDPLGRTTSYSYDALNRLVTTTYPDGSTAQVSWNKLDVGSITDRNGHATTFTYDGMRDLLTSTDPLGNTTTNTYYPNQLLNTKTDANGHTTTWQRDLEGRVTAVVDPLGNTTSFAYDPATDVRLTSSNALGQTTTYTYDGFDRVASVTDPNGVITSLTYTPRSWLASRIVRANANGSPSSSDATTSFTYDAIGDLTSQTDADDVVTNYAYDKDHRLTTTTDALSNTQSSSYDNVGNVTENARAAANSSTNSWQQSFSYDAANERTSILDAYGHTYAQTFDVNGRITDTRDPIGIHTDKTYDAVGNVLSMSQGATDSGQPAAITNYTYDQDNRVTSVSDPSHLVTSYTYDPVGQVLKLQSPDTGTSTETYDAAGNVLTKTDARGVVASYSYDALNRISAISYADTTQNVAYHYDEANSTTGCSSSYPIGHVTRIVENQVATTFCYDNQGDVLQKQQSVDEVTDTTTYGYSAARRLDGIMYPSGTAVAYGRDTVGRIQSVGVTPPGLSITTVVSNAIYQPFGPLTSYALGNSQQVARTYDANYRLTDLTSPTFTLHAARDAVGDITAIGNAAGASPATETYGYDTMYRLTTVTEGNGSVLESVTYNPTGDRLNKTGGTGGTGAYSYNTNTHQLIATGSTARVVDANGNTTAISESGESYGFGFSGRNRMTVAQYNGTTIENYTYNALNERVQKGVGALVERYDYNERTQLLGEYGTSSRDYVWLDGIPVADVDLPASKPVNPGCTGSSPLCGGIPLAPMINYIVADQLGTPRAISTSSNTLEWQLPYQGNPWNEVAPTGSYTFNLRSPGQYFDNQTGLNYNLNRDYNADTGRYEESDPLGLFGGQASTYAYVSNTPLLNTDPLGLTCAQSNGWLSCTYPGGPAFTIPAQPGFPAIMGPGDNSFMGGLWYHNYDVTRNIGCADPAAVSQGLINNPTPSWGNPQPATPGGTPNNAAVPGIAPNNPVTSYLTTDTNTGAPLVVNVTGPNSAFGPGYVAREVTNGVAHTYGEGEAEAQETVEPFGWAGNEIANQVVWGNQMQQIIDHAKQSCGCSK